MNKFEIALKFVLQWEVGLDSKGNLRVDGGYNDDDGSPTKWGIRQAANPGVDIKNLTLEKAAEIYRTKYWNANNLDKYELGLAIAMFDTGVNCGPARCLKWYDKIKDTKDPAKRLIELRDAYYFDLVSFNKTKFGKFLKGWTNRTADLKKYIDIERQKLL